MNDSRFRIFALGLLFFWWIGYSAQCAVIGTNTSAQPLTPARVAALPEPERSAWQEYLTRSDRQHRMNLEFFEREVATNRIRTVSAPKGVSSWKPLDHAPGWFATAEARRIADGIVSFQTPSGGWDKNMDMSGGRSPGMVFGVSDAARLRVDPPSVVPVDRWNYVGTFDNNATTLQLWFLARVISASTNTADTARYRASFERGIDFIVKAQMPNGGWPQVWPLVGDYHDAITLNDHAFANVLRLLRDVFTAAKEFAFVPANMRQQARAAFDRGLQCVLRLQVKTSGRLTAWAQQVDALTLEPTPARNFEMIALAALESATLVRFLMELPEPTPDVVNAVHAAAAWFEKTAIRDKAYRSDGTRGPVLVPEPGHGPIWARYYEIGTDRPIFGDRDRTIHDTVDEISKERRVGYGWFTDAPAGVLKNYAKWRRRFPATATH